MLFTLSLLVAVFGAMGAGSNHSFVSPVMQIKKSNLNSTLQSYEVVFINFYADWCPFSQYVAPIFEHAAMQLTAPQKVLLGRVDCMQETALADDFNIKKFPTLKLFYKGAPLRDEYRGQRSTAAFVDYVRSQLKPAITELKQPEKLFNIDPKRRAVIGYFKHKEEPGYELFEALARSYKNECDFYLLLGEQQTNIVSGHDSPVIVFRPDKALTDASDDIYMGNRQHFGQLNKWLLQMCLPMVREINFGNVEELIEQGMPLLSLFHKSDDLNSVKEFRFIAEKHLQEFRSEFNFITVDGILFQHSLYKMGKSVKDLPVIAIDSLKFMYPFPKFADMYVPGKLNQFLLHFLRTNTLHKLNLDNGTKTQNLLELSPSTFKKLGPSKHRYTLLTHDEL